MDEVLAVLSFLLLYAVLVAIVLLVLYRIFGTFKKKIPKEQIDLDRIELYHTEEPGGIKSYGVTYKLSEEDSKTMKAAKNFDEQMKLMKKYEKKYMGGYSTDELVKMKMEQKISKMLDKKESDKN